jgi:hypothetical protein
LPHPIFVFIRIFTNFNDKVNEEIKKMKKNFYIPLVIMLSLCATQALAQESKIIFEEHFNNNLNIWSKFDTTWASHKMDSGVYIVHRKNKYGNGETRTINFSPEKNFSIECSVKLRGGDPANLFGLIFGYKDWDNNYGLLVNAKGNYACQNYYQGINYTSSWKSSAVVNNTGSNKLGIIKFGDWLNYYINGVYMERIPYQPLLSAVFVLYAGGEQTVQFDDFILKYCDTASYKLLFGEKEYNKMNAAYMAGNDKLITLDEYISNNYGKAEGEFMDYILFQDMFNNTDGNWQTGSKPDTVNQQIKDSAYFFENFSTYAYAAYHKVYIDRASDYSISCKVECVKSTDDKGFGFVWGFSDWENYKSFQVTANGKYLISPYSQSESEWKPSAAILKKGQNTLLVERKGRVCYFYINKTLVDSTASTSLAGNTFGLFVSDVQTVKFDDVLIREKIFIPKTSDSVIVLSEKFDQKKNDRSLRPFYTRAAANLGMLEDGTEVYLNNNKYYYRHNNSSGNGKFAEVYIGKDNDFTIETTVKYEKGEKGPAAGIIWGFMDWDNTNVFMISMDGAYRCSVNVNKKEISNGWVKTKSIHTDASNKLTVHKRGSIVEYFINGDLVTVMPYVEIRGYNFGYLLFGKQTISSDKFEITEEKTILPPFNKDNIIVEDEYFPGSIHNTPPPSATCKYKVAEGKFLIGNGPDTTKKARPINDGMKLTMQNILENLSSLKKNFRIECEVEYRHKDCELKSGDEQDTLNKYDMGAGIDIGGKSFLVYRSGKYSTSGEAQSATTTGGTWINKLVVEVIDGNIYYYFNDILVDTQTADDYKNNGFSLVLKAGNVWQYATFDDLKIRYL